MFSPADRYLISEEERRPRVFSLSAGGNIRVVLRLFGSSQVAIDVGLCCDRSVEECTKKGVFTSVRTGRKHDSRQSPHVTLNMCRVCV